MTIKGIIENIEYRNNSGHPKKIVTLIPNVIFTNDSSFRQKAFIEFRGSFQSILQKIKVDDVVEVSIAIQAKVSQNSGIEFNNLVAYEIKKIE